MFNEFQKTLNAWNTNKNERQKLQHAYLMLAVLIIIAAGIIGLFNEKDGHDAAKLAIVSVAAYAVNAIVWSLLESSVINKLASKPRRR
jgi:hypothetical protein